MTSRSYGKVSKILKLLSKALVEKLDCGGGGGGGGVTKIIKNWLTSYIDAPLFAKKIEYLIEFECSKLNALNKQICVYNPTKHMSNMRSIRPVS